MWLLLGLAIMWCVFSWQEPKHGPGSAGRYVLPTFISVMAFAISVYVVGAS